MEGMRPPYTNASSVHALKNTDLKAASGDTSKKQSFAVKGPSGERVHVYIETTDRSLSPPLPRIVESERE